MQFSTLGSSNMEIFKPTFFDVLTICNDQISHINHVLDPLYVFFGSDLVTTASSLLAAVRTQAGGL